MSFFTMNTDDSLNRNPFEPDRDFPFNVHSNNKFITQPTILHEESQQQQQQTINDEYTSLFGIEQYDMVLQGNNNLKAEAGHALKAEGQVSNVAEDNNDQFINRNISFNMPGAFEVAQDNMELDESPPFTIESELFYDPLVDSKSLDHETESLFRANNHLNPNDNTSTQRYEATFNRFENNSRVPSSQNLIANNSSFISANDKLSEYHFRKPSIDSYNNQNQIPSSNSYSNASFNVNNSSNNNFYNELSPLTTTTSLTPSVSSIHSTQPSFFSAHQYLTRNSLDQPPSQSQHRVSLDLYSKNRSSIDSQHSATPHQRNHAGGRYTSFTNSISSYIPFMSDKNQRSSHGRPISGPPSPSSQNSKSFIPTLSQQQNQPSRHLIKSMFKSSALSNSISNNNVEVNDECLNSDSIMEGNINESDYLMISPTKEESEVDHIDSNVAMKKAKKSKRSLFTRFKTPVKPEPVDDCDMFKNEDSSSSRHNVDNDSLENSIAGNISIQVSSASHTPSSATTTQNNYGGFLESTSSNNSHNNNSNQPTQQEPDYAALFEKVGKRKNIVNPTSYIKSKPKFKAEPPSDVNSSNGSTNNSNSNTEKSSILNFNLSNVVDVQNGDHNDHSISGSSSNSSSFNNNLLYPENSEQNSLTLTNPSTPNTNNTSSSLATASKRILGSKLMSKKKNTTSKISSISTTPSTGVEVEIDLQSLDLPPNTQIFPTSIINSKNRTRGRKENKEADLVDSSKIYLCNYCSRRFKRQEHLKRHFRSLHTFEKPYDCTICNKKFSRSDNLNQHLKIHKQEDEMMKKGSPFASNIKAESNE